MTATQAKSKTTKGKSKSKAAADEQDVEADAGPAPLEEPLPTAPPAGRSKPKAKKQALVLDYSKACKEWFAEYADEDEPDKMGGDGIEKLFADMDVSMEGVSRGTRMTVRCP